MFEFGNFTDGCTPTHFVVNQKYADLCTAGELCLSENAHLFKGDYRLPTIDDVKQKYVRFYARLPDSCDNEYGERGYSFTAKGRGAFPVWAIDLERLKRDD